MERSAIRGRDPLTLTSAIPGATRSPSFNAGPAILGRSFAPARAVLGLDAVCSIHGALILEPVARRVRLRLTPARPPSSARARTVAALSTARVTLILEPAIPGATRSPSFNAGPAILGRSFAPARAVLGLDCASTVAALSTARVTLILEPAIPGATRSPSFNAGPAILGRSFAPARAVLGLDAVRRPSLTHLQSWAESGLHCRGGSTPEKVLERSRRRSRRRF